MFSNPTDDANWRGNYGSTVFEGDRIMRWPDSAIQYLQPILTAPIEWLKDESFVETLILACGINAEGAVDEMPRYFNLNMGMRLWQYPKQFAKYLVWLSDQKIESYLEIGTRFGGTFLVTVAYLSRFNQLKTIAGVDLIASKDLTFFAQNNPEFKYLVGSTDSADFTALIEQRWDLVFVDGDHTNPRLENDWELARKNAKYVALHDISNVHCPDVMKLWEMLSENYSYVEFTEQYAEVVNRTGCNFLGIGVVDPNS